jgi:hypothetical protein
MGTPRPLFVLFVGGSSRSRVPEVDTKWSSLITRTLPSNAGAGARLEI